MRDVSSQAVETGEGTLNQTGTAVPTPVRAERVWPGAGTRGWRHALLRRLLAIADVLAALLASLALVGVGQGETGQLAWALALLPLWILVAKLLGLYDRDGRTLRHLTIEEAPYLVLWALIGTTCLALFLDVAPANRPDAASSIVAGVVAALSALVLRALARYAWRRVTPLERVAIIGSEDAADRIRRKFELFPEMHATVVDARDSGHLGELARDPLALSSIDRICFAPESLNDEEVGTLREAARAAGLNFSVIPPCPGLFGTAVRLDHLGELPVLEYNTVHLSRSTLLLKRALDIAVSGIAFVVLAPVFVLVAVAIKLDSRGRVLFHQWRAGEQGRPFRMLKFRTMVPEAEELLPDLVSFDSLDEPMFKLTDDPRVTGVGRFLRRWSLDELPQLVNVLRGEMSLVGPRPEQLELVERYTAEQRLRIGVKPGLTGPMQVYGRGNLSMDERLAVEYDYIENLSIARDVHILGMTLAAVLRGKGAF